MLDTIMQGDARTILKALPDESVQTVITSPPYFGLLRQIFTLDVGAAMYPIMANLAKSEEIGYLESQRRIAGPRLDVMGMQLPLRRMRRIAALTAVVIPCVDLAHKFLPFCRRIETLTQRRTTVFVVGIGCASFAAHAVLFAAQPGLINRGFHAQYLPRSLAVFLALEWINHAFPAHIAIFRRGKILAAWPRRYTEVNQLLIDTLRVTVYDLPNVISGQTFNLVFLAKPVLV